MSGLAPPEVVNTRGVNEACSTSRMHAFLIQVPFGLLMATVAGGRGGGVVRGCVRIEDPDVEKCTL